MMKKTVESTGEVCVKFTDEEQAQLGIKEGDKFSVKEQDGGFVLEKFSTIELDTSDWDRSILEELIFQSCEKDVSVNDVISEILEKFIEDENLS
jgi:hypothetical protein